MHSCWYLQVCTEGGVGWWWGADCSTVLGLFTSRSEGGSLSELTDVRLVGGGGAFGAGLVVGWAGGSHARGSESSYSGVQTRVVTRKQNTAKKRLLLTGQHHATPTRSLELRVNTQTRSAWTGWFSLFEFCFCFFSFVILQLVIA